MSDLDVNPFTPGSQEYLAYQHAYNLASSYLRSERESMYGRVLGYMLRELPWDDGRSKIASEINSCTDERSLADLGVFYINHFLRACEYNWCRSNLTLLCSVRSSKGPTPAPSEHPSRPSFDDERDMNSDVITEAPQDHRTAKHQVNPLHLLNVYPI